MNFLFKVGSFPKYRKNPEQLEYSDMMIVCHTKTERHWAFLEISVVAAILSQQQ